MCGLIAASLHRATLDKPQLMAALAKLQHRGPEERSVWFSSDRRIAVGHVRLSIIGLANRHQPLASSNGELHCVVNGEFYGYAAQRDQLRVEGRTFATDSNSEIALPLYEKLGADFCTSCDTRDCRRSTASSVRGSRSIRGQAALRRVHQGNVFLASEAKALFALGVEAR